MLATPDLTDIHTHADDDPPGLVNEDHFEVIGEGGQHGSVSFEVNVANGNSAVTQEAKLSLNVELLQEEEAV